MGTDIITVSVDAMGGDNSPSYEVAGAVEALNFSKKLKVILVGQSELINTELKKFKYDRSRIAVENASEVISMHESPAEAVKRKKNSSILVGLNLVKHKEADAFISAGNTGAVMAASVFILGRISNVSRPTIGSVFPTEKGITFVADVGANVDCKPAHLLEFAVMSSVYVNYMFQIDKPTIGLLNVGEESTKGNQLTQETYELLEKSGMNFVGNVEGRDILKGKTNVVVCDGFTGNVILKFAESVLDVLKAKFSAYASRGMINKLKAGVAYGTLRNVLREFDYQEYGGVPFLGVNGISFIGHGRSTPRAFRTMILKAEQMVKSDINNIIELRIKDIKEFYKNDE